MTDAALAGRTDNLVGLKENVVLGHSIPVGTGYKDYLEGKVSYHVEEPVVANVALNFAGSVSGPNKEGSKE